MATVSDRQEYTFQAEIKQLLHLLSHSLYQSREIAVRELISNASDALDKMRYVSLTDESQRDAGPLEIVIEGREADRQLIIRDTGIGMTHDELVTNLGTIAHSGSVEFLKAMAAERAGEADLSLIGQFGVGFYSAFMIADRVRVRTRSYTEERAGSGSRTGPAHSRSRRPRDAATRHGSHPPSQGRRQGFRLADGGSRRSSGGIRASFRIRSVWARQARSSTTRSRSGSSPRARSREEQYTRFYQHLTHHPEEKPLWHLHLAADSPIQFRAIVYCPPTNLERLGFARLEHGLSLCAKRVLGPERLPRARARVPPVPPRTGRFRGLAAERLPRDAPGQQRHPQDPHVAGQGRARPARHIWPRRSPTCSGRSTTSSAGCSRKGLVVDPANRERIAKLLRFASSRGEDPSASCRSMSTSSGCRRARTRIYYLGGPDLASIGKSPNLEIFRRRGLEVLFLTDPIDEFAVTSLGTYQGKQLTSIDSADLDLPETEPDRRTRAEAAAESPGEGKRLRPRARPVPERARRSGQRGPRIEATDRQPLLPGQCRGGHEHPDAAALEDDQQGVPRERRESSRSIPSAPLIRRLCRLSANQEHDAFIKQCGVQLWANAMILDGVTPEPEELVARVQAFMAEAAEKRSPLIL